MFLGGWEGGFKSKLEKNLYFRICLYFQDQDYFFLFWHFHFFTISQKGWWLVGWFCQKQTQNIYFPPPRSGSGSHFQGWEANSGWGYSHPLDIPSSHIPSQKSFISNIFPLKKLYSFHPLPKRFQNEEGYWMQFGKKWIFYDPFNIPPSMAFCQARPIHKNLGFMEEKYFHGSTSTSLENKYQIEASKYEWESMLSKAPDLVNRWGLRKCR